MGGGVRAAGAAVMAAECPCCRSGMGWGIHGVCEECWSEVVAADGPACGLCGRSLSGSTGSLRDAGRCESCAGERLPYSVVVAWGHYDGRLRDLIHALKYGDRPGLASPLGERMAGALVERGLEGRAAGSVIVPVPTARARRAGRGYDQALLLARQVHKALKRAGIRPAGVSRAVRRVREGPPQTSLARKDRLRNPRGAFTAAGVPARTLRGRTAVLVDDVMTTGATIMACAGALRESGATDVIALVAARTPPPGSDRPKAGDRDGKDEQPGGDCEID